MSVRTPGQVWLAYHEAEGRRDHAAMAALVAPDLRVSVNGRPALGSAQDDERANRALVTAYPDYRRVVEQVLEAGDQAVVRWRMLGDPARAGDPPLDVAGVSVVTVRDGVMTQAHLYYDGSALDALMDDGSSDSGS